MPYAEFEQKLNSLSYEYRLTIFNMLDYFYEKQKTSKNVPSLEEARSAFEGLRKEAESYGEMTLDEINAEIDAVRKERKVSQAVLA